MKQLLKRSLVLVAMFATTAVYSNEFALLSKKDTNNISNVIFNDVKQGSTLLIKDDDGQVHYRELIEASGRYSARFDLSNLPDDEYYFELDMKKEIIITPFTVEAGIAVFKEYEALKIVKPQILVKDDQVFISGETEEEQTWKIDVYYDEGYELAHSEKLKNTQRINRVYDFKGSKRGNYTIVLSSGDREIKNSINFEEK
jgi:hypothetical protein